MRTLTDAFSPGAPSVPEGLRTLVVSPERTVEPGTTVRATFAFYNFGGASATGLRVRFSLPDGLRYVSGSARVDDRSFDDAAPGASGAPTETTLLAPSGADLGEVPPGVERRIALAYVVAPTIENGAILELQAALIANETEVIGSNIVRLVAASAPALQNPETVASLEALRLPEPGADVRVAARVHNSGHATAHDVIVVLPVPDHTTYLPGSARIDGREAAIDERDGDPFGYGNATTLAETLAAGASLFVEYRARIDSPLDDNVRLSLGGAVASRETAEFDLTRAELTVRSASRFDTDGTRLVVDASNEVEPGRRVRVAIVAENAGTCAAEDVRVRLTLPDGLRYAAGSRAVDGRSVADTDNPGAFIISRIEASQRAEASIDAYVVSPAVDGTTLSIAGSLQWSTGTRPFERAIVVRSAPRFLDSRNTLVLDGASQVNPGGTVRARIRLANDGTAPASGVRIVIDADPTIQRLRYIDEEGGEVRVQAGGIDLGSIAPGPGRSIVLMGTIASPLADRSALRLRARLESDQTPPLAIGQLDLVVRSRPRFVLATSTLTYAGGEALRPSRHGDVQVVLVNEGTDVARDVRVQLEISSAARIDAVDGAATRVGAALLFGDVAPGKRAEATVRLRLAAVMPRGSTITVRGRLEAVRLLPLALATVTVPTIAEPRFDEGASLQTQPVESVDAGEALFVRLAVRNTGDGAATRVLVRSQLPVGSSYLPGSTSINDVPLLDVDGGSVLWSKAGLVLEDVEPGVDIAVRYCAIVNTPLPAGTLIEARADLAWDGGVTLSLAAPPVRVRSTPAFAVRAHGLPFSVSGIAPRTVDVLRDVTETLRAPKSINSPQFVALSGATLEPAPPSQNPSPPSSRAAFRREETVVEARFRPVGSAPAAAAPLTLDAESGVAVAAPESPRSTAFEQGVRATFSRDALERALTFLAQSEHDGLVTHVFAMRTLMPTSVVGFGGDVPGKLAAEREALRGVVDRLFIKMRMPRYAVTAKDIEDGASRATLIDLLGALRSPEPGPDPGINGADVVLEGPLDASKLVAHIDALENEPLGTALPWLVLAELLPRAVAGAPGSEALDAYRSALIARFTRAAAQPVEDFHRDLAGTKDAALDGALRDVRSALRLALESTSPT